MNIESKINYFLNKHKKQKKLFKRLYQYFFYFFSKKVKFTEGISKISPVDNYEYFFGYYDKSPWDQTDRYCLGLQVKTSDKILASEEKASIVIFDSFNENKYRIVGSTVCWNIQQGCMLQWLGPDYGSQIIYNDFRNNKYCSILLDVILMREKILSLPVYCVASSGKFALSLDFSRLHRLRPGYGYQNIPDKTSLQKCPDQTCVWFLNLESNENRHVLTYADLMKFEPKKTMLNAEHKVNHIMINPSGTRFMFIHRWILNNRTYSRLITAGIDGKDIYYLSDNDMVSHCYWKNDEELIAFLRKEKTGNAYYLLKDKTQDYSIILKDLKSDGHPSYSPDKKMIVTDCYPDKKRISKLYLCQNEKIKVIAEVFSPFKFDNEFRCDLHPRWNRQGNKICFDAVFEGKRGMYEVKIY